MMAQTRWDMPVSANGPSVANRAARVLADKAGALSGNALLISVYDPGRLMAPAEIKEAVRKGVVPIGEITLSLHAAEAPVYGLDTLPFLATNFSDARKLYALQKPWLEKRLADEGLVLLASVPFSPQGLVSRKPLTEAADLAGLRLRAYNGFTKKLALRAGCEPVAVETADLPDAVRGGRLDAFTASPAQAMARKAAGYAPFFHKVGTWIARDAVVVNKAAFEGLAAEDRKTLIEAARQAEEQGWAQAEAEAAQQEERLKSNGFSVVETTQDFHDALRRIGRELAMQWLKDAGEDGNALLARIYAE
ncbi:MAG: TRAP transporter substrate-binding protein DctP [Beijerinckiaceae bacterium]